MPAYNAEPGSGILASSSSEPDTKTTTQLEKSYTNPVGCHLRQRISAGVHHERESTCSRAIVETFIDGPQATSRLFCQRRIRHIEERPASRRITQFDATRIDGATIVAHPPVAKLLPLWRERDGAGIEPMNAVDQRDVERRDGMHEGDCFLGQQRGDWGLRQAEPVECVGYFRVETGRGQQANVKVAAADQQRLALLCIGSTYKPMHHYGCVNDIRARERQVGSTPNSPSRGPCSGPQ